MLTKTSTQLMKDKLLPKEKAEEGATPWIYCQLIYVVINAFLSTYYDTSSEITDSFDLEPNFLNTAWQAFIPALTIGLVLSICQGKCYKAQSKHFNDAKNKKLPALSVQEDVQAPSKKNSFSNKALAFTHYLAEVNNDIQPMVALIKLAELNLTPWQWRFSYLGIAVFSLSGNILELITTFIALKEEDGDEHNNNSDSHKTWKCLQFVKNMLNTFLKTNYTVGSLVTELANLEKFFLGISWQGYVVAMPLAMFFSACESVCHDAESDHFITNHPVESDVENPPLATEVKDSTPQLTTSQHIFNYGHYCSDIVEGLAAPLATAKKLKVESLSIIPKVCIYMGMSVYSFFGNMQEFKNTRTAFLDKNLKNTKSSSAPKAIAHS